jgi:hypothetical protein
MIMDDLPLPVEALWLGAPCEACDTVSSANAYTPPRTVASTPTSPAAENNREAGTVLALQRYPARDRVTAAFIPGADRASPARDMPQTPSEVAQFFVLWMTPDVTVATIARAYGRCYRTILRWSRRLGLMSRRALLRSGPGPRVRWRLCEGAWPVVSEETKTLLRSAWPKVRHLDGIQ